MSNHDVPDGEPMQLDDPRYVAQVRAAVADRIVQKERAVRGACALAVADAAFKAAWPVVLAALNTVPHDAEQERAIIHMFDIERELKKITDTLRRLQ